MKAKIKKAIVVLLIIWFSVTCYSSFGRIRKTYFSSSRWHSPYLEMKQEIRETKELLERAKRGEKIGLVEGPPKWQNPYMTKEALAGGLAELEMEKLKMSALNKFVAILPRFRRPSSAELHNFYEDAHRIVKGELYLLFLLNAIPVSLAGAIFYLLKDENQLKD